MKKDLHWSLWVVLPVAGFLLPYLSRLGTAAADGYLYGESGWVELLTVMYLLVAILFGVMFLVSGKTGGHGWLRWWMTLLVLGSVYFAGEEASWGQHIFGWETPEQWLDVNDQGETNIHNTSVFFDQLPRALLSVAALVGGVMAPLYCAVTGRHPARGSLQYWLWPTYVCLPATLLSLLVSWHEKMYRVLGVEIPTVLDVRAGEVKESLLALFIMLYVMSVWYRNRVSDRGCLVSGI